MTGERKREGLALSGLKRAQRRGKNHVGFPPVTGYIPADWLLAVDATPAQAIGAKRVLVDRIW